MGLAEVGGAIAAAGTPDYVGRLVDFVGSIAAHDRVTVTRYSSRARPAFVTYRNFSAALVERYLSVYYAFDPFNAYWCERQRPGVVALRQVRTRDGEAGRYVGEFLDQSAIRDEVGVLLADGPDTTLGVFLERRNRSFASTDIARLQAAFPAIAAVHDAHRRLSVPALKPHQTEGLPRQLWPHLTPRERDVAGLMLAGHPTNNIARRLGITQGTVRNYRHSIYGKLDITTERELILLCFAALPGRVDAAVIGEPMSD